MATVMNTIDRLQNSIRQFKSEQEFASTDDDCLPEFRPYAEDVAALLQAYKELHLIAEDVSKAAVNAARVIVLPSLLGILREKLAFCDKLLGVKK